jgi:hypothetical protein
MEKKDDPVLAALTDVPEMFWKIATRAGVLNRVAYHRLYELAELGLAEMTEPSRFRRKVDGEEQAKAALARHAVDVVELEALAEALADAEPEAEEVSP